MASSLLRYMNKTILKGRIGSPPALKLLPSGDEVVHFSVATLWGREVDWHRCTAFGEVARDIAEMASTGDFVWVEGSMRTREIRDTATGKTRRLTELVIAEISVIEKQAEARSEDEAEAARPSAAHRTIGEWEVDSEERPSTKPAQRGLKCL